MLIRKYAVCNIASLTKLTPDSLCPIFIYALAYIKLFMYVCKDCLVEESMMKGLVRFVGLGLIVSGVFLVGGDVVSVFEFGIMLVFGVCCVIV